MSVPGFAKPGYSEFLFRVVSGHCRCLCLKLNGIQELGYSVFSSFQSGEHLRFALSGFSKQVQVQRAAGTKGSPAAGITWPRAAAASSQSVF